MRILFLYKQKPNAPKIANILLSKRFGYLENSAKVGLDRGGATLLAHHLTTGKAVDKRISLAWLFLASLFGCKRVKRTQIYSVCVCCIPMVHRLVYPGENPWATRMALRPCSQQVSTWLCKSCPIATSGRVMVKHVAITTGDESLTKHCPHARKIRARQIWCECS